MKQVILKSIKMVNFKGEKERTTLFNDGVTIISGANGLGKSRHFDAFLWLLFGKDAQERKDYEIKTRVNGVELHKAECSVEGVIAVDGETITLKRALVEDWVKPRGQVEQRFKGNHTECWWNDTPVNVSEYDSRVKGIVDASIFKMITNPAFFVGMKWQLQREQLFQIANVADDAAIAAQNPDFALLLDKISGKSLADYKKELAAKKKRLNSELEQVQPRIKQTIKLCPETEDFDALRNELAAVNAQIANVDKLIADASASIRASYEAQHKTQQEINTLLNKANGLVSDAQQKAYDDAEKANEQRRKLKTRINDAKFMADTLKSDIQQTQVEIARFHRDIESNSQQQEDLRKQWFAENQKQWNGETNCPHCGQPLPQEKIAAAQTIFANTQREKCEKITQQGKGIGEVILTIQEKIKYQQQHLDALRDKLAKEKETIESLQQQHDAIEEVQVQNIDAANVEGYAEIMARIESIKNQITTDNTGVDTTPLTNQKAELYAQRDTINAHLANEAVIDKCKQEVIELETRGKELGQQIADVEREEYVVQQFTATKINDCEQRINGMFKYISFRLFDYTIEGNPVETCIPLINGVPYGSANHAAQVNAGLDIINALCAHYDICAPIFIDNSESVNNFIPTATQMVLLRVTDEQTLTIN